MAFVTAPDFPIKTVTWTLDRPSQVNASAWTGTRTVIANPWHGKWTAHVELATQQDETSFRTIRSFFVRCKGSLNTFRLYATAGAQNGNGGVTVSSTAAAAATTIAITGAATTLLDGQFFTVNGQLCCCTADQSGSTLTFEPPLRQAAASGTTVVTSRPYALVYLSASSFAWQIASWRQFGLTFDVEEAILETDGTVPEGVGVAAPTNSVAPAVSGSPVQGQTVTCSTGTWTGSPTYTYQWNRNGSPISSATANTYVLVSADVGQLITCTVTASNSGGSASATSGSITPVALSSPAAVFTMTQLPDANRIYQRSTLTGGGQGKGQGTIAVTINPTVAGALYARIRSSDTTTILQTPWLLGSVSTGSQTVNVTTVDARLGWFYVDLSGDGSTWTNGTTLIGMGALFAMAGQSLMSRFLGRVDNLNGTFANQSVTPSANSRALASYHDGGVYMPSPSTMTWLIPADYADGAGPNSLGTGQFLNDAVSELGVNCGVIGHAYGGIYLGQYVSGQADWTQFSGVIAKAGGAFEAFFWGQGHSDSSVACSAAAYSAQLDILYAQVAAINSFSGFKTYIWTIPAVTNNTLGTSWQYTQVRKGASDWCTANSATYVHAYDLEGDGVHPYNTALGQGWLGRTMFRATRANYGLSSGLGPSLVSATRSGTTITLTLTDVGQTTISLAGSAAALFFAFRPGESNNKDAAINDNRYPFSSVSVTNKTTLSLVLANDPGVGQALDLWLNYGITAVDPGTNYIVDDRTDDGLSRGRNLQANFAPIVVAAPTPGGATNNPPTVAAAVSTHTMTGTSMTYGTAATGFGTRRTGGTASTGAQSLPAFTFECFIVAPTAGAQLVIANGLPGGGGDWLGIDSTNHINSSSGASGATALTAGKLYHVAFVRGPTGMRVYIKNITDATASVRDYNSSTAFGTAWAGGPSAALQLGHLGGSFVFTGAIDEAAVFYGERYTGTTHTPPTTPYVGNETNLMMLWHLDSNLTEAVQH